MSSEINSKEYIYLDYAATAPLCKEAYDAMVPHLHYGREAISHGMNANSVHTPGRKAHVELENARRRIAAYLGASRPDEIIFTSGATEADNEAVLGIAHTEAARRNLSPSGTMVPHVITSAIEHDAVLAPMKKLEVEGFVVTYINPTRDGFIDVRMLEDALRDETVLVSIQMANSEIGSIQPIQQLASAAHAKGALFHTDATQALGKVPLNLGELNIDAASFSAHKIGGPKGVGALYLKSRTPFEPQMLGGGQEGGKRSGTQNICGAAGFAAACEAATCNVEQEQARLIALRDNIYDRIASIDDVEATVEVEQGSFDYLPNIANMLFRNLESDTLTLRFDALGFAVSGGSACSSHSLEPSHVLRALGIAKDSAQNALRVSMGRYTTNDDIDSFLNAIHTVIDWENR